MSQSDLTVWREGSMFWGEVSALSVAIVLALATAACVAPGDAARQDQAVEADHFVPSRPETVSWGWYPIDKEPVVTIQSGQTVRINTLTHAGTTQREEPVAYLTGLGRSTR